LPTNPRIWNRDRHLERRPRLIARARIVAAIRQWFTTADFVEVDPAALQASPGNETHLHGFRTILTAPDGGGREAFLHTSPEFAMKKLLAAGEERIFALAHVFRNRERTALHAPEFTMLEWYRVGEPLEALIGDCARLLGIAASEAGARRFAYRGRTCDPFSQPERLSVADAFSRYAGIDMFESLSLEKDAESNRSIFARQAVQCGLRVAADDTWSDIFSRVLSDRIEPCLGVGRPTILGDYPASEAALARLDPRDPRLAERFELYCCGVELANAFHELTDAAEQRLRFVQDMAEKQRIYGETYPLDEDFLAALAAMPDASGCALGLDRLVMLATGANRVEDVQWTPVFDLEEAAR
jgi:lysyl-tRNA synthetase class 2